MRRVVTQNHSIVTKNTSQKRTREAHEHNCRSKNEYENIFECEINSRNKIVIGKQIAKAKLDRTTMRNDRSDERNQNANGESEQTQMKVGCDSGARTGTDL